MNITAEEMQADALDSARAKLALIEKEVTSIRDHLLKTPGNLAASETYNMTVYVHSLTRNVAVLKALAVVAKEQPKTPLETLLAVQKDEPARYAKARDMFELRKRQLQSSLEWEELTFQAQLDWTEMAGRF